MKEKKGKAKSKKKVQQSTGESMEQGEGADIFNCIVRIDIIQKCHLNTDLKQVKELVMQISEAEAFQEDEPP